MQLFLPSILLFIIGIQIYLLLRRHLQYVMYKPPNTTKHAFISTHRLNFCCQPPRRAGFCGSRVIAHSSVNPAGPISVYIVSYPLVGLENIIDALPPFLSDPASLHQAVVVHAPRLDTSTWLFDFIPLNPTDPRVISQLIALRPCPAQARVQCLKRVPSKRCRLVRQLPFELDGQLVIDRAKDFQNRWMEENSSIQLLRRDCRHHVEALIRELAMITMY